MAAGNYSLLSVSTKSTTLSKDKRNHCGKALFCVFPPIPPFRRKPAPQTALPLLTAVFLFNEVPSSCCARRRHMSACVTDFKFIVFRQTVQGIIPCFFLTMPANFTIIMGIYFNQYLYGKRQKDMVYWFGGYQFTAQPKKGMII